MRKFRSAYLLLLLLFAGLPLLGQTQQNVLVNPDCNFYFTFSAPGNSANYDNRTQGCVYWQVTYYTVGFSAVSVAFQSAPDNLGVPGSFSTFGGTVVSGTNPDATLTQSRSSYAGFYAWLRISLASATGSGIVVGRLYGWRTASAPVTGGGGGSTNIVWGPDAAGAASTEPPVQTGGLDPGGLVRYFQTDASGRQIVIGPAASGTATAGNPVLAAGSDGTDARTIATDTSGRIAAVGAAANGAAVAGNPVLTAWWDGTSARIPIACNQSAAIAATVSGNTQIVGLTAGQSIYICHVSVGLDATANFKLTSGTGTNCGTGTADVSGLYYSVASIALDFPGGNPLQIASGDALCINLSGTVNAGGLVQYAKF